MIALPKVALLERELVLPSGQEWTQMKQPKRKRVKNEAQEEEKVSSESLSSDSKNENKSKGLDLEAYLEPNDGAFLRK